MITLEKLLSELKAESLNEIVAAGGCKPKKVKCGKHGSGGGSSSTASGCRSWSTKSTNSGSCS